ncbi:MAG: hydroxyacylglutathione hydrolase [Polyangiaceae bacterium]
MLKVTPIPCLEDNYAYLLDDGSGELALVDPSEGGPVFAALERAKGKLVAILATHHHHDHVGGNEEIVQRHPNLRVYGYESDRGRIPCQTEFLRDGDKFTWGKTEVRALHIPGHTLGAVAYVMDDALFTGDTLFLAGCGRLFEGTPAMMYRSLNEVLGPLGESMRVYCGHEYTVSNLAFAASVEPGNARVEQRMAQARSLRAQGEPTVGAPLSEELATNPFMRCKSPEIRKSMNLGADAPEIDVLAALRKAKDTFRAPKLP